MGKALILLAALCVSIVSPVFAQEAYGGFQTSRGTVDIEKYIVPGISTGGFIPLNRPGDFYYGAGVRIVFFESLANLDRNVTFSGWNQVTLDVSFYKEMKSDFATDVFFTYVMGYTFSLESGRSLKRNFLIPGIGFKIGGIQSSLHGSGFVIYPSVSLAILTTNNVSIVVDNDFFLSTVAFTDFMAYQPKLGVNLTL